MISEESGASQDIDYYRAGIVFTPRNRLAASIKYYLPRPELRQQISAKGRDLFRQRSQTGLLVEPVNALLEAAGCGERLVAN